MSHRHTITIVLLLVHSVVAACCSLVPNYEVLPTPIASSFYEPGRGWDVRTGSPDTVRNPDVGVTVHEGLAKLDAGNTENVDAKITVPLVEWIGGTLGITNSEKIQLSLQGQRPRTRTSESVPREGTGVRRTQEPCQPSDRHRWSTVFQR